MDNRSNSTDDAQSLARIEAIRFKSPSEMTLSELAFIYKSGKATPQEVAALKRALQEKKEAEEASQQASFEAAERAFESRAQRAVAEHAIVEVSDDDAERIAVEADVPADAPHPEDGQPDTAQAAAAPADSPIATATIFDDDITDEGIPAPIDPRDHLIPERKKIASLDPYSAMSDDAGARPSSDSPDGDKQGGSAKQTSSENAKAPKNGFFSGFRAARGRTGATVTSKASAPRNRDDRDAEDDSNQRVAAKAAHVVKKALHEPIFVIAFAVLMFLLFFMRPFIVPSASMQPTLQPGDRIFSIAQYFPNGETYSRGDIACFTAPDGTVYVKRVIGIGGDRIQISGEKVYVNGEESDYQGTGGVMTSMDVQLADDEYWMMGDNRGNSADSRYIGPVKAEKMISKVFMIYQPFDRIGLVL